MAIEKSKLPEGQIQAVLSTDALDRHGERVDIKGISVPKNQTIKMYYNHQTSGDALPIGKWLKIWKSGNKLMGQGEFDMNDPFATMVYQKVLNGFIDSISIGFYPKEFDADTTTWTKSELVEASVVAEPANPEATITSKELGFTAEEFDEKLKVKLAEKQLEPDPAEPAEEPELPEDEPEEIVEAPKDGGAEETELKTAIDVLYSRMDSVEDALEAATDAPTMKNLIKVRVALKQVDQAAETANKIVRIQLKENQ